MKIEKTVAFESGRFVLRTDIDISALGCLSTEFLGAHDEYRFTAQPSRYADHAEVVAAAEALAKHTSQPVVIEGMEVRA